MYQKNRVMAAWLDTYFGGSGDRARSCKPGRNADTGENCIKKGVSNRVLQPLIELVGVTWLLGQAKGKWFGQARSLPHFR